MCTAGGEIMTRRTEREPRQYTKPITVFFRAVVIMCILVLGPTNPALGQQTPSDSHAVGGATAQDRDQGDGSVAAANTDQQDGAADPLSVFERWTKSLEALRTGIEDGTASAEDADQFFTRVSSELASRRAELAKALRWARSPDDEVAITPLELESDVVGSETAEEGIPSAPLVQETPTSNAETHTLEELHAIVVTLYNTRISLLEYVTPALRRRVTGLSFKGFRELIAELELIYLDFRYQSLWIPARVAQWPDLLKAHPGSFAVGILKLLLALLVFRWWRRWAPTGLIQLQERLLAIRPRQRLNLRLARFLWYLNRVRPPLEWLALLAVFATVVDVPFSDEVEGWFGTVAQWILLAWFTVVLLNAMVARRAAGLTGRTARIRLTSFVLVVGWLVLLGLGLDLSAEYGGRGTIYSWVWPLFGTLGLPLLLVIMTLWRGEIFDQLETEPRLPSGIERTLEHQRGPKSLLGAARGGLYLIYLRLRHEFFEAISGHEFGRRFRANLETRDMLRESKRLMDRGEPIPPELRQRLIVGTGSVIDKVARTEFLQLVELAEAGYGGLAFVVAERGGGKTTMMRRLETRFDSQVLFLDCPLGGYEAFHQTLAGALGLNAQEASVESLKRQLVQTGIRIIAVDNYHRLRRPMKGGNEASKRVGTLIVGVGSNLLWVATIDRAAWQYIRHARDQLMEQLTVLQLSDWTEDQLGDLLKLRCAEADIDPDFGKLRLQRLSDTSGQETAVERNRLGFSRFVWNTARGNPGVALRLFANSLVVIGDGGIEVRLPLRPPAAELMEFQILSLLVLRVIAQCELATADEIAKCLDLPKSQIGLVTAALFRRGYIEQVDNHYHLSWTWFRTVTDVLARKNLLPR